MAFVFNGKEISAEELQAKMAELQELTKLKATAKKAGLIVGKTAATPSVRPAEITLLVKSFEPIINANGTILNKLFTDDYKGQDSISFNINDNYAIIIRDRKITAQKAATRKAKLDAENTEAKEKKLLEELLAAPDLTESNKVLLKTLQERYPEVEVEADDSKEVEQNA